MWRLSLICIIFSALHAHDTTTEMIDLVGSHDIDIRVVPHQVAIVLHGRTCRCGGSIIAKDIILTAAKCVSGYSPSDLQVRVGSSFWESGGLIVPISNLTYNSNDDVGLLKLSSPLEFSDIVKRIDMVEDGEEIDDDVFVDVTGWGNTGDESCHPYSLQMVSAQKLNDQVCRSAYAKVNRTITRRMLCTWIPVGAEKSCYGNAGGPLVYNGKLVGVVPWDMRCIGRDYPAVYTKVSALRIWIDDNMKHLSGQHGNVN